MLKNLTPHPADKILALMAAFKEDPRAQKVDLGVGVYKDASGNTPVMRAVKTAEKQLWEAEATETYVGLVGDPAFNTAMRSLILGDAVDGWSLAGAALVVSSVLLVVRRAQTAGPSATR